MADAVLTTKLSRRTMLAGGSAAISVATAPLAAFPDAELLRRIAAAARLWDDYIAAREYCTGLFAVLRRHPDYPKDPVTIAACAAREALAVRTGARAADDYCEQVYERHEAALHAAFDIPARTLPGLRTKMASALKAAKDRDYGTFEESDYRWLNIAMVDMDRLAGIA